MRDAIMGINRTPLSKDDTRTCPFCGEAPLKIVHHDGWCQVKCGNCGANGPNERLEADAISSWELRVNDGVSRRLTVGEIYWLDRRAEIIAACAAEGLQIMSDQTRVWLRPFREPSDVV